MDFPPSGWYPDPYGVPGLLRWWDGSTWTHHTHPGGGTDEADSAEPAATVQQAAVQQAAVQPTAVQPAVEAAGVQPTTVQPAVRSATVPPTTVQPTTVQPAVRSATVPPATVQPAVQATAAQPAAVQATAVQPGVAGTAGGLAGGTDANGTQVLFLGDDAWTTPGTPGPAAQGSRYGYHRAQRRRRIWLASGLAGGTVVALAVIALVVNNLGRSSSTPVAARSPATPTAQASTPSSVTPSPSPTPSVTQSNSVLADGQSGLAYTQLATPWQPDCPSGLNNQVFTWTAGESAVAGQIDGGQTTWYGAACSGPLPQQYGYNGVADLQNTATNLVNTFNGAYYSALQHNFQPEVSQPVQVSGHPGWEIKFGMSYPNAQAQGATWNDEQGAVVVADLGAGLAPAVFYVSIPGNLGESNVDSLVSSLQLTAVPQVGGSPTDSSPADGSPAPGGDGGGGN
jgi:Protein of unknown function (DUF2510)